MSAYLNLAQVAANIKVLGYGQSRVGIWTQGCILRCPGCSSVHTHNPAGGRLVAVGTIIDWIRAQARPVTGLTISGGEPTTQASGVLALIQAFLSAFKRADVLMFSGLPWRHLITRHCELVAACDVIIAGPYVKHLPPLPLRGSSNQTVHLLTDLARERYHDIDHWPVHAAQVVFGNTRVVTVGIPNTDELTKSLLGNAQFDPNTASWTQRDQRANQ